MTPRTKLAIGATVALLGASAGVILASGDGDAIRTRGEAVVVSAGQSRPQTLAPPVLRSTFTTTADPGGWCPKCDGPMSSPLTDDDIRQAGDAAYILVLGLREPRGIGEPTFVNASWHSWSMGDVPLVTIPTKAPVWPSKPGQCIGCGPVFVTPGPVPEPGAWGMMLIGLGAVGVVARRRR